MVLARCSAVPGEGFSTPAGYGPTRSLCERNPSMSRRKVAVLYLHPLFGEGIARLLETDSRLKVARIDGGLADARDRMQRLHPDVVIAEGDCRQLDLMELFREMPEALLICVKLGDNAMNIYRNWRVATASPEDLREAILSYRRSKPSHSPPITLPAHSGDGNPTGKVPDGEPVLEED